MTEHLRYEVITCPACNSKQVGEVCSTFIWNSYVHECTGCEYIIMESEWVVDSFKTEYKVWQAAEFVTADGMPPAQVQEEKYIGLFRVDHKHQLKAMVKRLGYIYKDCYIEEQEPF